MNASQLFYVLEPEAVVNATLQPDAGYRTVLWRPTITSVKPTGLRMIPFGVWWVFHYLRLFANRDYRLLAIYNGSHVIHRSCVFPGYFRFPFMARLDVQIGDTWTDEEYRGQGLATYAIGEIVRHLHCPGRRFWYVVASHNQPSIRVAEKSGFCKVGHGQRTKRFGLRLLGAFRIDSDVMVPMAQLAGSTCTVHANGGGRLKC